MRFLLLYIVLHISVITFSQTAKNKQLRKTTQIDSAYKVSWLKQNAVAIRSIDSTDDDFSDLMPLKKAIGDAQVVFLGESSHWTGPTYHMKTRLIKFLHQEMGFHFLATESSIDGTATTWKIMKEGKDSKEAFRNSVTYGSHRIEIQPLRKYLKIKANSPHPLELIGFDVQMTGRMSHDSLPPQLRRYFSKLGYSNEALQDSSDFMKNLRNNSQLPWRKTLPTTKYNKTFDVLIKAIDSFAAKPLDFEAEYFKQVLKSTKKDIEKNSSWSSELSGKDAIKLATFRSNMRDEQMADNFLWYFKKYPNKKFIVSAHNGHLLHDFDPKYLAAYEVDTIVDKHRWDAVHMGAIIKDSLGKKIYNIAIVGNRGTEGRIDLRDSSRNFLHQHVPYNREEQLENLFYAAGFKYGFVDLKCNR